MKINIRYGIILFIFSCNNEKIKRDLKILSSAPIKIPYNLGFMYNLKDTTINNNTSNGKFKYIVLLLSKKIGIGFKHATFALKHAISSTNVLLRRVLIQNHAPKEPSINNYYNFTVSF